MEQLCNMHTDSYKYRDVMTSRSLSARRRPLRLEGLCSCLLCGCSIYPVHDATTSLHSFTNMHAASGPQRPAQKSQKEVETPLIEEASLLQPELIKADLGIPQRGTPAFT